MDKNRHMPCGVGLVVNRISCKEHVEAPRMASCGSGGGVWNGCGGLDGCSV